MMKERCAPGPVPDAEAGDQNQRSNRRLLRSASTMSLITMLSRVLGLVREQARAYFLGTSAGADAFGIAFLIPNLFRRLVGEGAMTAAFIPVFSGMMKREQRARLCDFANKFFLLMSVVLTTLCVVGILSSGFLVRHVFARGFAGEAGKVELTASLTRWMFFYLFFIGLAAIAQGILNSFGRFAVPAFTPVLLNLAVIGSALLLGRRMEEPAYAFAVGVMVGGVLQLGFQLPFLYRLGFRVRPTLRLAHSASREVLRLMIPAIFGMGIYQINVSVSMAIASYLGSGAVSSLQYSARLMELTLGVFVISISTVILPAMSRQVASGNSNDALETLSFALRMAVFISLPAAVGLILLRLPVINLLFGFTGGQFDRVSAGLTSWAVLFHLLGLVPLALTRVSVSAFYAAKDTKTPVKVAFGAMVVNIAGCLSLPVWLGHGGIALANTLSALFHAVVLMVITRSRFGAPAAGWRLAGPFMRMTLAAGVMGGVVFLMNGPLFSLAEIPSKLTLGGYMLLTIAGGALLYLGAARLVGSREPGEFLAMIRSRSHDERPEGQP